MEAQPATYYTIAILLIGVVSFLLKIFDKLLERLFPPKSDPKLLKVMGSLATAIQAQAAILADIHPKINQLVIDHDPTDPDHPGAKIWHGRGIGELVKQGHRSLRIQYLTAIAAGVDPKDLGEG